MTQYLKKNLAKMPDFPEIAGIFIFGLEHVVKIDQSQKFSYRSYL